MRRDEAIARAPRMLAALKAIADMRVDERTQPTQLLALCMAIARAEVQEAKQEKSEQGRRMP